MNQFLILFPLALPSIKDSRHWHNRFTLLVRPPSSLSNLNDGPLCVKYRHFIDFPVNGVSINFKVLRRKPLINKKHFPEIKYIKSLCLLQKQPPEVFCKKGVLKNFANFTGKHLCWSLFIIKLQT